MAYQVDAFLNDTYFPGTPANGFNVDALLNWIFVFAGGAPQNYVLDCGAGAFVLTGQNIDLLYGHLLSLGAGSFALVGQDVSLLHGSVLSLDVGAFALTGQSVGLLVGHVLSLGAGTFALSGQTIDLLRGYLLALESGAFALIGQDISFLREYILTLFAGSFTLIGQNVDLIYTPASPPPQISQPSTNGLQTGLEMKIRDWMRYKDPSYVYRGPQDLIEKYKQRGGL